LNGKFGGGKGTYDNPYLIEDIYDFNNIRIAPNKSYKLINNIDFSIPPFNLNFLPISNFSGQLDGNGFKLLNVYIHKKNNSNVGIFSNANIVVRNYNKDTAPYIKNLVIENIDILGKDNVGALFGYISYDYNHINTANAYNPFLSNIYVSGRISSYKVNGGLIGRIDYYRNYPPAEIFSKDIQTNVTIAPMTSSNWNSLFIGYFNTNQPTYAQYTTIMQNGYIKGSLDTTYVTTQPNQNFDLYNANFTFTNTNRCQSQNVITDKNEWTGEHYSYINQVSYDVIEHSNSIAFFYEGLDSTSVNLWRFWYNHSPELNVLKKNFILICDKDTNKYYTFEDNSLKEVTIYDTYMMQKITSISEINNSLMKAVRKKFTNYQFVNIVDKTNGTELTDQPKISLTRDTAHDFNTRYVFRKTFKFSEIGEDIFKIRNSTQEK